MKKTMRSNVGLFTLAAACMLLLPAPVLAESPVPRDSLERMFAQIREKSTWDLSREMLWGYFFTNGQRQPLERAAKELSKSGYRVVAIYLSEKDKPGDPDLWWLHVERVERHSVDSLHQRNKAHASFAKRLGLASYDGMDVGPAGGRAN